MYTKIVIVAEGSRSSELGESYLAKILPLVPKRSPLVVMNYKTGFC
jgi:hypothetical protein